MVQRRWKCRNYEEAPDWFWSVLIAAPALGDAIDSVYLRFQR